MNVQEKKYADPTQFATVYFLTFVPKNTVTNRVGSGLNSILQKMGDIRFILTELAKGNNL